LVTRWSAGCWFSSGATLFRAAGRAAGDVDEHDRQAALTKRGRQRAGLPQHFSDGVDRGIGEDALLQVNDDQSGFWIEGSNGHEKFTGW
jgi:hypothetical protein